MDQSIFTSIDPKLNNVAKKLKATIATESQHSSNFGENTLASRRLVWIEDQIGKAIIVTTFHYFPDSSLHTWSFRILAWVEDETPGIKPTYEEYLLKNVPLKRTKENIDNLLSAAQEKLKKINRYHLK